MAISIGKDRNWGSRSGKKKRSVEKNFTHRFAELGLPNDLLKEIANHSDEIAAAASDLLQSREARLQNAKPAKIEFRTSLGKLYKGDCLSALKKIEDNSIDCIFADPPFNLSKEYENGKSDNVSDDEYLEWTHAWVDLCSQKLKEGGALFIYNIPKWACPTSAILNQKLTFRHWVAIDITFSMPIPSRLYPSHYALLYYVKGKPGRFTPPRIPVKACVRCGQEQNDYGGYKKKMNPSGINIRDVWTDIPPVRHAKHKNRDANELSLKLLDRVLDIATKEGDLVFDPFGGSGTTFIAAELKGRRWVGSELGDCTPIKERFARISDEREKLAKIHKNLNTLFTDKALQARLKSGLPLDNFCISKEQVDRVIASTRLKRANPESSHKRRESKNSVEQDSLKFEI